jgi:uncharacterized membrane protein YcaP (DUF421 family)
MGKREIGEMQPFELVITLVIAEVACIPMNDPCIPFYAGVVPIVTLAFLQIAASFISQKSLFFRRKISGSSVMLIDKNGINYDNMSKLNMNVSDLVESIRSGGTADVMDVMYAIIEPNGKICIVEKEKQAGKPITLPISIIVNGKWCEDNIKMSGIEKVNIISVLNDNGVKNEKDVNYADVRQDGTVYFSVKNTKDFSAKIDISGGDNW